MSAPAYDSYKKSGVEWLGKVPSHWRIAPFWSLYRRTKRTGFPEADLLSVYRDYGVIRKSDRDDNFNNPSDDLSTYQLVEPGDLAMNKMKAWQGSLGVSAYRGIVSPAYFVFQADHTENRQFLHYLLRSPGYAAGFMSISKGIRIGQWDIDPDHLRRVPVPLPTLAEQAAIAAFLDRETGKIDALVDAQTRLIERLKEKRLAVISRAVTKGLDPAAPMKSSGVEWLGQVPAHWRISKLKFVARIQTGVAKGKTYEQGDTCVVPYLRVANVQDGWIDLTDVATIELPATDIDRYRLRAGDVLMNEGGDFDKLGRGAVWDGAIDPCVHQNHVFSVRPVAVSPEWLDLTTSSDAAQFFFMRRSKQSTNLASISSTSVMELPILVPPADEQDSIVDYVARASSKLNDLMSGAAAAINLLQERRAALISAAVTGKIDVRSRASEQAEAA